MQDRWKEYIEDLYDKNNKPQYEVFAFPDTTVDIKGPPILLSEFEAALNELKWKGRCNGELLKALGAKCKRKSYDI